MISYSHFLRLLYAVPDCATLDEYISECGGSVHLDDVDQVIDLLGLIYKIGRDLSIKNIAASCGVSVRRLSMSFGIPTRTLENWASGASRPPQWQLPLIAYAALFDFMQTDYSSPLKSNE